MKNDLCVRGKLKKGGFLVRKKVALNEKFLGTENQVAQKKNFWVPKTNWRGNKQIPCTENHLAPTIFLQNNSRIIGFGLQTP